MHHKIKRNISLHIFLTCVCPACNFKARNFGTLSRFRSSIQSMQGTWQRSCREDWTEEFIESIPFQDLLACMTKLLRAVLRWVLQFLSRIACNTHAFASTSIIALEDAWCNYSTKGWVLEFLWTISTTIPLEDEYYNSSGGWVLQFLWKMSTTIPLEDEYYNFSRGCGYTIKLVSSKTYNNPQTSTFTV